MSAFDDFLADPTAERCWLLEIDAFSITPDTDGTQASGGFSDAAMSEMAFSEGGGTTDASTLYYSSHGFVSQAADSPASTYYEPRLTNDVAVLRAIVGNSGIGGLARTVGECTLLNADGGLDATLAGYALDGRPVRLLIGRTTRDSTSGNRTFDARSAYNLVFSGVIQSIDTADARRVRLQFSDAIAKLGAPLNATTYAGTGALEGGSDLKGKPKPRSFGHVYNASAPLVDSAQLIYQVNDGAISDVPAVYDRGVLLTQGADYADAADLNTNAPAAGTYRVLKSGGYFRLGSTPSGTVTADVLGDATGGYVNKAGDILQRVILVGGIDSSLIDAASFTQLNTDAPAEVGIFVGTDPTKIELVAEALLATVGAYGGFSRLNLFTVGVVKAASGTAAAAYTTQDIIDLRRLPLPADVEPAVWRARVAWQRNYTVQSDLASAAASRVSFTSEPERVAMREDLTVKSQRQLAREYGPTADLYAQQADADTEALRRLNLWKGAPSLYEANISSRALARDLGDVVTLTYPRYVFTAGRDTRVLGHRIDIAGATLMVLA